MRGGPFTLAAGIHAPTPLKNTACNTASVRSQRNAVRNSRSAILTPCFIVQWELTNVAKKRKALKKKTAPARKATVAKKKAPAALSTTAVKTRQGNQDSGDQATEFFRRARGARFFPTS